MPTGEPRQRTDNQGRRAIVHSGEPLAEGSGEPVIKPDRRIRLELLGSEVDIEPGVQRPAGGCSVASTRLGRAELSQGRPRLGQMSGKELESEHIVELSQLVAIPVDRGSLGRQSRDRGGAGSRVRDGSNRDGQRLGLQPQGTRGARSRANDGS